MCTKTPLLRVMTSPSKLAERLERLALQADCGSSSSISSRNAAAATKLLSLDIRRDRIGLAVVTRGYPTTPSSNNNDRRCFARYRHPSSTSGSDATPCYAKRTFGMTLATIVSALPSIPTPERRLSAACIERIYQVVQEHAVAGFLVNWPVERDTGKLGAKCGRVLYTLEALWEGTMNRAHSSSSSTTLLSPPQTPQPLFSPSRPICLWDTHHTVDEVHRMDEWGRCSEFTRTSNEQVYLASKERYFRYEDDNSDNDVDGRLLGIRDGREPAVRVWDDFCRAHWPSSSSDMVQGGEIRSWGRTIGKSSSYPNSSRSTRAIEYVYDDEGHIKNAPQQTVKHLFVDRQLRLAVAAA